MTRFRLCITALVLAGLVSFWPNHAESKQYFDANLKFDPMSGLIWNYQTFVTLIGTEIQRGARDQIGGIIWTIYDETIDSSGQGLVSASQRYHIYESLDLNYASQYEDPSGGPVAPPDYSAPAPGPGMGDEPSNQDIPAPFWSPMQSYGGGGGGGGGGSTGGGGGGGGTLMGEAEFDVTPILESNIRYVMSESGRILDLSGMDLIGDFIDPSRSITVRQVFQTNHLIVLPDYQVPGCGDRFQRAVAVRRGCKR